MFYNICSFFIITLKIAIFVGDNLNNLFALKKLIPILKHVKAEL